MVRVSTSEAREQLSDIINRVAFGKERQILSRRGTDLVAVISIDDLHKLEMFENAADLADARSQLKIAQQKGTKSWDQIKIEAGL